MYVVDFIFAVSLLFDGNFAATLFRGQKNHQAKMHWFVLIDRLEKALQGLLRELDKLLVQHFIL